MALGLPFAKLPRHKVRIEYMGMGINQVAKFLRAMTIFAVMTASLAHAREESCAEALIVPTEVDHRIVRSIGAGTTVQFEDGSTFQILDVLSLRNNGIFLLPKNRILRVALYDNKSLEAYVTGYRTLAEHHVPVAKMFGSNPKQWVVSEYLDIEFLLRDVVEVKSQISDARFIKLLEEFKTFAFKFAGLNFVDDLSLTNVAYVKNRGWMIIDWLDGHKTGRKANPFVHLFVRRFPDPTFNNQRLEAFRVATDETIAFARGHSPEAYYSVTLEQYYQIALGKQP